MKSSQWSTGRLLGSVSLRYWHPCAMGVYGLYMSRGGGRVRVPFFLENTAPERGVSAGDEQLAGLEAVLFLSQQPLTSRRLAVLAGLADGTKARTLVRTLNRRYDGAGSAFRVEEVAGGFQLMTRSKFAPWLRRLHSTPAEVRLSAPAMETLAVVAYRQPVLRAEIEAIRGVQSGEILRQLIERDLVRIVGRSDELGRPFLYGTTKQFLQVFGLRQLDELPNQTHQSLVAEEETNVKTLITTKPRKKPADEDQTAAVTQPRHDDRPGNQGVFDQRDDDEDDFDEEEDFEDEEEDEDEDEEEDEDDLDDEPWEEVEDDDEDLDEDEDEDEDWDEDWDDEDWDEDDDDDLDEDDDGEEEEEEEKDK